MLLIAFGHRTKVGKDSAAKLLKSHLRLRIVGSNIQTRGFADKIKDICYQLYAWTGLQTAEYYEHQTDEKDIVLPKLNKTPRDIWIEVATGIRRAYDDTWVDYLWNNVKCDICLIRDMRFPNEADRIKKLGGFVFKVTRRAAPVPTALMKSVDDPLENYDGWDAVISNDETLKELNDKVVEIADRLIIKSFGAGMTAKTNP